MKKILSIILFVITAILMVISCGNSPTGNNNGSQQSTPPARKKVGLVLGGGGAKGAATIGVLKVIEQSGVKIDYIAGTSIGAIIGALYAAGYTSDELIDMFANLQWLDLLKANKIEEKFKNLLADKGVTNFNDLKIPFRCVASNINTGKDEVFANGLVATAMRASMSIPPIYKPVEYNNEKYVDGGFLNNLPVDVAKSMGADVVIVIDLQQPKEESDFQYVADIIKKFAIIDSVVNMIDLKQEYKFAFKYFKTRPDTIKYVQNKRNADIYINPQFYPHKFGAASFGHDNCFLMFDYGKDEGKKHIAEFQQLQ